MPEKNKFRYPFSGAIEKWRVVVLTFLRDLQKIRNILQTNFELGKKHYGLGNFSDAVLRFKFVTWLEPKHASGWYWLGLSHLSSGQKPAAIKALKKALEINPELQGARDALAAALAASENA